MGEAVTGTGLIADKATVMMIFLQPIANMAHELQLDQRARTACALAEPRLLGRLRRKMSGVYSVGVSYTRRSLASRGLVYVTFTCCPQSVEGLVDAALDELRALQTEDISAEEIRNLANRQERKHATAMKCNSNWLSWALDACKREAWLTAAGSAEKDKVEWYDDQLRLASSEHVAMLLSGQTSRALQSACSDTFDLNRSLTLYLLPDRAPDREQEMGGAGREAALCAL